MCVACAAAAWWSTENGELIKERLRKDVMKVMKEKYGREPEGSATDTIIDAIQKDFQVCHESLAPLLFGHHWLILFDALVSKVLRSEGSPRLGELNVQRSQLHQIQSGRLRNQRRAKLFGEFRNLSRSAIMLPKALHSLRKRACLTARRSGLQASGNQSGRLPRQDGQVH